MGDYESFFDPLDIELDSNVPNEIYRLAYDELSCSDDEIFFYGRIVDLDLIPGAIDENKYYSRCPCCGSLVKQQKKPKNGDDISCPNCSHYGELYDFRDPNLIIKAPLANLAYLETIDEGFVLRLFEAWIDYSDRDYDDYEKLSCNRVIVTKESAREYWYRGEYYFYENLNGLQEIPEFFAIDGRSIDDTDYWIYNYDNVYDPVSSSLTDDIKYNDPFDSETCIEALTSRVTYRTFRTLKKYGFDRLAAETIYVPNFFRDSSRISEVLSYDYNKLKAGFRIDELTVAHMEAIRALEAHGVAATDANANVYLQLGGSTETILKLDKPRRLFKYLRNQARREDCSDARDYVDYIRECEKLCYNLGDRAVLYPSVLAEAHRRTTALLRIENSAAVNKSISDKYAELHTALEWRDERYAVVMPRSAEEIIAEGAALKHCVGNYCERVAKDESYILFLRRVTELDKPFYTVEIRPNLKRLDIVQCRGYQNRDYSSELRSEVEEFLGRYEKWFNKRKFERAESDVRTYYKAVRKTSDGRYISAWDNTTEYIIGKTLETRICDDPDRVAVQGIHVASLDYAKTYGYAWENAAILEVSVNIRDLVVPNAKDQVRASRVKVIREVPMIELGEWGERHAKMLKSKEAVA